MKNLFQIYYPENSKYCRIWHGPLGFQGGCLTLTPNSCINKEVTIIVWDADSYDQGSCVNIINVHSKPSKYHLTIDFKDSLIMRPSFAELSY